MRQLIAGNWKMNGSAALVDHFAGLQLGGENGPEALVCPPAALVDRAVQQWSFAVGGQDCHSAASGAHTGDQSPALLQDLGARYCIVGHSERRQDHGEEDGIVNAKASAALAAGLVPIICVGEQLSEREAGRAEEVVRRQLLGSIPQLGQADAQEVVVAYEPVWAIGTGVVATPEDVAVMHAMIRDVVGADTRILYGGSMKPANAEELLSTANVDGGLIGGASLKLEDFQAILLSAISIAAANR